MILNLPTLIRTTTFRVALLHTVLFGVFVFALLVYLYASAVIFVRTEASASLDAELFELEQAYTKGGLVRLNQSILERSFCSGSAAIHLSASGCRGQ